VVEFSEILKKTNLHFNPESALNSDVILVANRVPLEITAKWGTKPTLNGSFPVTTLTINIKDSIRQQLKELVREDQEVQLSLYLMKNKFVDLSNRELATAEETVQTSSGTPTTTASNLGLANDVAVAPTGTVNNNDTNANDRYILIPMVTESDRAVASKQLDAEQVFALEEGTNNIIQNSFAPNALKDLSELDSLQNLNSDRKEARVIAAAEAVRLASAASISTDTARIRIKHLDGATGYLIRVKPAGQLANFLPFAQVDNGTNGFVATDTRIKVRRLQDNAQVLVDAYRRVGRDGSLTPVTVSSANDFADGVLVVPVAGQEHIDLTLENVAVGQQVHIIPQGVEDFDTGVANKVVVLQDKVAPMHLLQTAYGVGENRAELNTNPAVASFARDGELFQQGEAAETDRLALPIQPRHLGVGTGTQLPARTGDVARATEVTGADFESVQRQYSLHGLTEASVSTGNDLSLVESRASAAYTKPDATPADRTVPTDIRHNLYTAEGFAAWNQTQGGAKQIGIGFSEDIKFAGDKRPELQLADGTASTNLEDYQLDWAIRNDNRFADDNAEDVNGDNDYLLMTASKLADFANNQHGQWLAFGESIQDEHGNAADKDNRLMVRDLMPPLVTEATLTNEGLRVIFNEPVRYARPNNPLTNAGQQVTLGGRTVDLLTQDNAVGEGTDTDGLATEFLIPMNRVATLTLAGTDRVNVAANPVIRNANAEHTYFELNFDNVQDARGNRWAQYNITNTGANVDVDAAAGWFISPNFLFVNRVNELDVNLNNPRVAAGSTELSFTLTTNAPLGTGTAPTGAARPSFLNDQGALLQGSTACSDFTITKNASDLTAVTDFNNCRVERNPGPGISYTFTVDLDTAAETDDTFDVSSGARYFTNLPLTRVVGEVQEEANSTIVN
jgi:hypothetical protein